MVYVRAERTDAIVPPHADVPRVNPPAPSDRAKATTSARSVVSSSSLGHGSRRVTTDIAIARRGRHDRPRRPRESAPGPPRARLRTRDRRPQTSFGIFARPLARARRALVRASMKSRSPLFRAARREIAPLQTARRRLCRRAHSPWRTLRPQRRFATPADRSSSSTSQAARGDRVMEIPNCAACWTAITT